jgi:DNA-directed RNA polymerase I, II, and III subunit RPABC3
LSPLLTPCSKYFASFGGLLLYIEGPFKKLTGLKIDNIYMLLKR